MESRDGLDRTFRDAKIRIFIENGIYYPHDIAKMVRIASVTIRRHTHYGRLAYPVHAFGARARVGEVKGRYKSLTA